MTPHVVKDGNINTQEVQRPSSKMKSETETYHIQIFESQRRNLENCKKYATGFMQVILNEITIRFSSKTMEPEGSDVKYSKI